LFIQFITVLRPAIVVDDMLRRTNQPAVFCNAERIRFSRRSNHVFRRRQAGLLAITPAKIDCLAGNHSTNNISFSRVMKPTVLYTNHWLPQPAVYSRRGHCSLAYPAS
jgi:hypothetical protein